MERTRKVLGTQVLNFCLKPQVDRAPEYKDVSRVTKIEIILQNYFIYILLSVVRPRKYASAMVFATTFSDISLTELRMDNLNLRACLKNNLSASNVQSCLK